MHQSSFPPNTHPEETLIGTTLWGHIGRENPHWKLFTNNPDALMVFSTSHAYISPSSYEFTPAAPTLDYAAVHLTGTITILQNMSDSLKVVEQTVTQLESGRRQQWDPTESVPYFERIIDGVVSFAFEVKSESSMFKLSQDMPENVQERICRDLQIGDRRHPDVVELMCQAGISQQSN